MDSSSPHSGYIYCLIDPRTADPRYVGWTTNPRQRLAHHLRDAKGGAKCYRNAWIRKLLREGVKPQMIVLEENPPNYANAERNWIARYRAVGYRLTNQTDGGDGAPGYRHTEKTKELLRQLGKRPLTSAQLAAREALKGKPLSEAHRAAISASTKGIPRPFSEAHKAAIKTAANRRDNAYLIARNKTEEMRITTANRNRTPEHKAAVKAGLNRQAPETKAQIALAISKRMKGVPKSSEARAKMKEAQRNRPAELGTRHSAALKALPPLFCSYCAKKIGGGRGNLTQHERACKGLMSSGSYNSTGECTSDQP